MKFVTPCHFCEKHKSCCPFHTRYWQEKRNKQGSLFHGLPIRIFLQASFVLMKNPLQFVVQMISGEFFITFFYAPTSLRISIFYGLRVNFLIRKMKK